MKTQISVPVDTQQFVELVDFLRKSGDRRDPTDVVGEAIDYWMSNAEWKPELLHKSAGLGYQWKNLFLSDGTEVRMQYKGEYYYANVAGDRLLYNGESITPGALANAIAGSSRNAWRDLWLRRPGEAEWRLADECRSDSANASA